MVHPLPKPRPGAKRLFDSLRAPSVGPAVLSDDQMHVGAASITELPADLLRRAKAGDRQIVVHEDSEQTFERD